MKPQLKLLTVLSILLFGSACTATPAEKTVQATGAQPAFSLKNLPPIFQMAKQRHGWTVLEAFPTGTDLQGWIVQTQDGPRPVFTDSTGHMFLGELISPSGEVRNKSYMDEYLAKVDVSAVLSEANFIQYGGKPGAQPDVVVFYEPYCPFCSKIFAAMKPYLDDGKVIHFLPLAWIEDGSRGRPSSESVVHTIMTSGNPAALLAKHEQQHIELAGAMPATDETRQKLLKNSEVMQKLGITGTPSILVRKDDGTFIKRLSMIQLSELPALLNMPRQDSADQRLVEFGAQPGQFPVN